MLNILNHVLNVFAFSLSYGSFRITPSKAFCSVSSQVRRGSCCFTACPQITVLKADSTPCAMSRFPWKLKLYNRNPQGDDSCVTGDPLCVGTVVLTSLLIYIGIFSSTRSVSSSIRDRLLSSDMLRYRQIISRGISRPQKVRRWEE